MSERSAATAVSSPVPSLLSRALDVYIGGWGGQAALYGITFVLALAVALVAELRFAVSTEYTLLLVVAFTVILLVCLPLGYAILFSPEAKARRRLMSKFKAERKEYFAAEREREYREELLRQERERLRREWREGYTYYEAHRYAASETEAESAFKEAFLSVFLHLLIIERERRRYTSVGAPGERDYEAATSAAEQALSLFIRLHNIEVRDVNKEELAAAMNDAKNLIGRHRSSPQP